MAVANNHKKNNLQWPLHALRVVTNIIYGCKIFKTVYSGEGPNFFQYRYICKLGSFITVNNSF